MRWPWALGLALVFSLTSPPSADARRVYGAEIPDVAEPINRKRGDFIVRKPWNKLIKELRRTYRRAPGIVMRRIRTPPSVKAYYIQNVRRGRTWDGINVYQDLERKATFITVLPHRRPAR